MTIYTKPQRILIVILVSLFATLSGFASNIYLSSIPSIATDLSVSIEAINLTVTGYMIFQALTPTFWGALSDSQGRRIVYICTLTIYLGACIGLALTKTYAQLLVLRCLQSSGSASTIAMGAGVIGDISSREERGGYMGYFQAGLLLPVAVGPLVGGALQNALGWHAVFWFLTVYGAVCLLLLIVLLPETLKSLVGDGSVPLKGVWTRSLLGAVQQRRLKRMKPSADHEAQVETTKAPPGKRLDLLGPFRILLSYEAAIAIFFIGIHYTVWQMVLTILPTLFESTYRLSSLQTGLVYIANGAGCIIGTALTGKILDADYRRIKVRYTDDPSAFPLKSARLRLIWVYAPMQCAAVLVFGWTLDKGVSMAVPIVCLFFLGWTAISIQSIVSTFLVDVYTEKSASAMAALNLVRCLLGAAGTAAVAPCVGAMNVGWTMTLLAGVMVVGMGLIGLLLYVPSRRNAF